MTKVIKMTRDFPVARDGITVETWEKGRTIYDAPDDIADDLMRPQTAAAEEVKAEAPAEEPAARPVPAPARGGGRAPAQ